MKRHVRSPASQFVCDDGRDNFEDRHCHPIYEGNLPTDSEWSLTVLRSASRRMTKLIRRNGEIEAADDARTFSAVPVDVDTFDGALELLGDLNFRPDCAIVLGGIAVDANRKRMRRLSHPDKARGDPATLRDLPRRFFPLDVYTVSAPDDLDRTDLESAARKVRDAMPPPFRSVKCIAVATSGYLIKSGLRFRMWFYLDKAMTCAAMKQWLRYLRAQIDFLPMQPAGLNYTAAPIFEDASHDPLPDGRIIVLDGSETVATPDQQDTPEMRRRVSSKSTRRLRGGTSALIRTIVTIRGAEPGERHTTFIRAAHRLQDAVEQGTVTEEDAETCLREAGARIGMPDDETFAMSQHAFARKRDRFPFEDERQK